MTVDKAPGRARTGGMIRQGVWLAVLIRSLGDRRFQANVITKAIGAYALVSLIKKNQARAARRAVAWYNVKGQIHDMKVLHDAQRAVEPGRR